MKKMIALVSAAMAGFVNAAVTEITAGQTITVTDADITAGTYADGFAFADATGVLEFNTSAAPTMTITGAGTVKKTSSADWTMSVQLPNFSGDYILQGGGRVTATGDASGSGRYLFGNDTGALDIRSGAELYVPNTKNVPMFYAKLVKVAGNGAANHGGYGAIWTLTGGHNMSGDFLQNLKLTADARVNLESSYLQFFNSNGKFDMDGHRLKFTGNGTVDFTGGFTVVSNGTIDILCYGTPGIRVQIRNRWTHFEETDKPFEIWDVGSIYFYYDGTAIHDVYPIRRPLVVHGKRGMIGIKDQNKTSPSTFTNLNANVWASEIAIDEGKHINMFSTLPQQQFNVTGPIKGAGSVSIGAGDLSQTAANENRGRIYFANTNNTYQGFTYVNNFFNVSKWGQFLAAGPHSIPNYSSLTGNYGTVSVRLKERESEHEELWTDGTYLRDLANETTWLNRCGIGLDTTFYDGVFTMAFPTGITNSNAFIGGSGPGEVVLTNAVGTAENPLRLLASGGVTTVKTKPGEPQYVGEFRAVPPSYGSTESVLCIQDSDLIMPDSGSFDAGYQTSENGFRSAIQLKNTRLIAENLRNTWSNYDSDVMIPGNSTGGGSDTCGLLEIYDGTVITGRLAVTGRKYGGYGAVYQYGGSVTALGRAGTDPQWGSAIGGATKGDNNGYYEMHGGEFIAAGSMAIGYLEGGYWKQFGGTFRGDYAIGSEEEPLICLGRGNGSAHANCLHVMGGTFDVGKGRMEVNTGYSADHQYAHVTVEEPGSLIDLQKRYIWPNNIASAITRFTLANGGRMRLVGLRKAHADSELSINFNGGIWECSENNAGAGGDIFHTYRTSQPTLPTDVYVYEGGATIDTAGTTGNGTYRVINGAFGGGVTGLAEGFTSFKTGPFEPIARIYGDGKGAVAAAVWDKGTGMVTGIRIIAPGVGYTTATVKFCYGRRAEHESACTVAANVNTGSFTKTGSGEFFLAATNTWGGATVVKGGTLKCLCDCAVPTNSAIVLAGGDLDFNDMSGKVSSVTYGVGGGRLLNAGNVILPETAVMTISTAEIAAGKKIELTGDMDLSSVTLNVTGDATLLDDTMVYPFVTVADGTLAGPFAAVNLDPSFTVTRFTVRVRLSNAALLVPHGFMIFMR